MSDFLREEIEQAMAGMYRRAEECKQLRGSTVPFDSRLSRLKGKEDAYSHCAEIIKEVLERTARGESA